MSRKQIATIISIIGITLVLSLHIYMHFNGTVQTPVFDQIETIAKNIDVIVLDAENTRTLKLDDSKFYCESHTAYGGSNPEPHDLAYPNAPIKFYMLEDIIDPEKLDNYGDTIIRMNPVENDGRGQMVIAMFFEGGYEKQVLYKGQLIHHYTYPNDGSLTYGIRLVDITTGELVPLQSGGETNV